MKNCGCGSPNEVLPEDGINIGAIGVLLARIPLPRQPTMVGVFELDHEAMYRGPLLLHVNEDTTATVGETIDCVDVVDEHDLCVDLEFEDCLERCVPNASGIVRAELLNCPAGVLSFDGEQSSLNLVKFGVVPGIDLGICAVNVDGIVDTGVSTRTYSGFQKGNVFICLVPRSHPV